MFDLADPFLPHHFCPFLKFRVGAFFQGGFVYVVGYAVEAPPRKDDLMSSLWVFAYDSINYPSMLVVNI